jgi:hypothetical protein
MLASTCGERDGVVRSRSRSGSRSAAGNVRSPAHERDEPTSRPRAAHGGPTCAVEERRGEPRSGRRRGSRQARPRTRAASAAPPAPARRRAPRTSASGRRTASARRASSASGRRVTRATRRARPRAARTRHARQRSKPSRRASPRRRASRRAAKIPERPRTVVVDSRLSGPREGLPARRGEGHGQPDPSGGASFPRARRGVETEG